MTISHQHFFQLQRESHPHLDFNGAWFDFLQIGAVEHDSINTVLPKLSSELMRTLSWRYECKEGIYAR